MKKILFLVLACFWGLVLSDAVAQTVYNGTPPTFMTFTASYVKCRYGTQWCSCDPNNSYWTCSGNNPNNWTQGSYSGTANNATNGILTPTSTNWSHRFITSHTATDPCMCYQTGAGTYAQATVLPEGGWDLEPSTLYDPIDTVIQLGGPVEQGKKSQSIEYWFRPDPDQAVILVMLAFATEASNHPTYQNAKFYVEVMDSAYNLLNLGYYPDLNGVPQNNTPYYWPYSRFLYVPINPSNSTCHLPYCLATPVGYDYYGTNDENKAFEVTECPYAQFSGQVPVSHSGCNSQWFKYTQIAFDVRKAAQQHKTVIFRVRAQSCVMNYHWAYGYFTAKLIDSHIKVSSCGDNEVWLSVPNGFSENSYVWYAGADSASAVHTERYDGLHNIFLNYAAGDSIYPYYRCEVRTQAGVPIVYQGYVSSYHQLNGCYTYEQLTADTVNHQYQVRFSNCSQYTQYNYDPTAGIFTPQTGAQPNVEWDFGDGSPVSTAFNPIHVYDTLGVYRVQLVQSGADGQCPDTTVNYVRVEAVPHSGIQDHIQDADLTVHPNPTSGLLDIETGDIPIHEAFLYDLMGKLVMHISVNDTRAQLDLTDLTAGTYLLKIKTDKGDLSRKVVRK